VVGFIGQGFIGKNYADDFEKRGFRVVRYSLEPKYAQNKKAIADCDIIFIAVPTPTTPKGFDDTAVRDALSIVRRGKIAVIKSTIIPGTTESLQKKFPDIFIFHSPEFLTEVTASFDAGNPTRNVIGTPIENSKYLNKARDVLGILPKAPFELICDAKEAELIKYGGNIWFYLKVVYINMLYDLSIKHGADWQVIQNALSADPRIGSTHLNPIHKSGRGAGGNCFIKDFSAFASHYKKMLPKDALGIEMLMGVEEKNISLLRASRKDEDILQGVYGSNQK
jgi:UDPglucose 6-dehydrogenase